MMRLRWYGVIGALVALVMLAIAQDSWQTHRGSNQRIGTTTNARNSAVNFLLAWTYPPANTVRAPIVIDNDTPGATSFIGDWKVPTEQEAAQDPYLDDPNTTQPYRYTECVPEPLNPGDPAPPEARFTWRSGDLPSGYYRVFVYVPSIETRVGGVPRPYARAARYLVSDGTRTDAQFFVNQQIGGWIPLSEEPFFHDGTTEITVTLTNLTVVASPDYNLNPQPIVAADAVRFVPDYGITQASPVVIRSPLNSANHLVYIANGNGTITCIENPVGTVDARVRWTFTVPNEPTQGEGQIYDDADSSFTAGAFTLLSNLPDQYGTSYHALLPTDIAGNTQRAYWRFQVPNTGEYYVYAWFPSSDSNARNAEYTIDHVGGVFRIRVDQRRGGRWVLLNQQPLRMRQGTFYEVSVNNFSPTDVLDGALQVVADAIRVVPASGLGNGVFSTPAVGQVRVRDGNSTVTRWVVVFGAQNGRVYCVDALGDGQFGTNQGETKLYWAVKPATSTSFSYASPLILENEDLVIIGNPSGSVYAINTAHDPNQPDSSTNPIIRWEYQVVAGAFVSTPAYDPSTNTVYIGSSEGGNQFGRLYALNPTTNDDNQRLRWAYPPLDQDPIEPITSTPAVALGRVYITTGGLGGGRIYAIKADNGSLVWSRPPVLTEFLNFLYSSPLVVQGLDYKRDGNLVNALYVGTQSGRILALDADTGALLHISENLGGALFSSPVFTNVVDTDQNGNNLGAQPAVVVATNAGQLLALHADDVQTDGRRAFEGWDLYSDTGFSSVAVLDNWMYYNDDAGITYAYNVLGTAGFPPESGLGDNIPEPTPETTPDGGDYSKLRVSVTTKKEEADAVLAGQMRPDELDPLYPEGLEWGDTLYVVVWNFKQGSQNLPIRVQLTGPGITRVEFTLTPRQTSNPPQANPDLNFVAVQSITIQSSGNNFYTPGEGYELQVRYGNAGWTSDLALDTPELDRPGPNGTLLPGDTEQIGDTQVGAGWRFGIANPLALEGIGVVGAGGTAQNLHNGNNGVSVSTRFLTGLGNSPIGEGTHGTTLIGNFLVRDRRTPQTTFPAPVSLNVRAYADDLRWQGGVSAVIGLLPWEQPPTVPNRSPDYPDISARRMGLLVDGGTDLQRAPYRVTQARNQVDANIDIPRYQPANEIGYSSVSRVYVDSNNNGRFDGLENVLQPGVNQGRVEAYRDLSTQVRVLADPRLTVEESVIDFGSLPAGFGFNWGTLFVNDPNSLFRPDAPGSLFAPFWKEFTVRNEGNINLFPVYLGKAFNNPTETASLFGDIVSPNATIPAWTSVVSTLDPRFFPQPHPRYPSGQPYAILQKPQVNDFSPTVLATPAIPPRRDPNEQYDPPVKPQVSIAIPPFQPMGTYAQRVAPYWDRDNTNSGVVAQGDPFATPSMQVVVRVRETQLTGSTNQGVQPMIDPVPPANSPRLSNLMPAAIRNPVNGNLHLYFASNRATPSNPNSLFLFKSTLRWNPVLQDGVRTTNGWFPFSQNQWWEPLVGPYPNDANGSLFSSALNLGRALTTAEQSTIVHYQPVLYQTIVGSNPQMWLFWTGEVQIRNQTYSLQFYVPLDSDGNPSGNPRAVPIDPAIRRTRPVITGIDGVGHWLFYVANVGGRSQVFYIASERDSFDAWRREQQLVVSQRVRAIESVSVVMYRVSLAPNSNQFVYLADVTLACTTGDRNESEVLLQRYIVNPRSGTLLPLDDSRAERLLGVIQDRFLPTFTEVAQKDTGANIWRVRHLDWVRLSRQWNLDPSQIDLDIQVNGVSVIQKLSWGAGENPYQEAVEDLATGVLQYEYVATLPNNQRMRMGTIRVDARNGTIHFLNMAPSTRDIVTVTYRPRVYRLTPIATGEVGSYTQVQTLLQRSTNPRHPTDPSRLAGSPVRKGIENGVCDLNDRPPVDRQWILFRRAGSAPNSSGGFFYKTLRPGIRLNAPILTIRGQLPLQPNSFVLAEGANHATLRLTTNNPNGANIGFYEYDALRGNIYFSADDIGKEVVVRYLSRDRSGNVVELEETQVVRWIDEGNLPRSFSTDVEYLSPIPIDLPTNELYLWAMPNLEFRAVQDTAWRLSGSPFDEALLLFWSSTRNGLPDIYAGAIQPRFYISPFDPDGD